MKPTITAIERDLRALLSGDVEFDAVTRHLYATDGGLCQIEPLGVVAPRDAEDVAKLVAYATAAGLPLVPRGAGSGLAGAAVGAGLQVDFTRYMNRVLEVAADGSWARVQPGLVMGVLNEHVKPHGTFFAPNPSSENYCSLGGMIANNSSGSRSVAYGATKDHVLALEVVLDGGQVFRAGTMDRQDPALRRLLDDGTRAGRAYATLLPLLEQKAQAIDAAMPRVMKNCSGYRVETVLDGAEAHLHKIFVGSEGTLGLITEATLNLVPLPGRRAIAMAYFPSVFSAGEAVFPILGLEPTSLEIMDSNFLSFVRQHDRALDAMLPQGVDTALLVEFEAGDNAELGEKLDGLGSLLAGGPVIDVKQARSAAEQKQLWAVRQAAVPLLQKLPGPKRVVEFVEDVTVHPEVLAQYMSSLQAIFDRYDVQAVMYGHAGDGNIHTRPLLNPKDAGDLRLMQTIMDEAVEVVRDLKGTPSGEHGDGLIRTSYIKQFYGDEVYGVFEAAKQAFDPAGIMNPGKKVANDLQGRGLPRQLRYGPDYWVYDQPTLLSFPDGEYQAEIEKCHGCAQCKSLVATTMCPTYKHSRREHASPRAKANVLRNIIQGKLHPSASYESDQLKEVTDYCIECGMCALECPSNVNIPKLMLEAKAKYRAGRRAKPVDVLLGRAELVSKVAQRLSRVDRPLLNQGTLRRLAEGVTGIDRRRTLPHYATKSFEAMLAERGKGATQPQTALPASGPVGTVAFFYDLFANYNDPGLAQTMENLLRAHGLAVEFPPQRASGVPEMLYGFAELARQTAAYNVQQFAPYADRGDLVVSGEPTASFAFKTHYVDYLGRDAAASVAASTRDLGELLRTVRAERGELAPKPAALPMKLAYHQPCHLKVQQVGSPFLELLREVPDLEVVSLDAGCCGMAGTFGMKAGTFDLSMEAGRPLFDRVAEVAPELVVSECSTCRLQLEQATGYATVHPAELIARAYGL